MITEAIAALNEFLISSPTDAEAWAELADLYASQGLYPQAIFSLEEVLLVTPYAWNVSSPSDPQQPNHVDFCIVDSCSVGRNSVYGGNCERLRCGQVSRRITAEILQKC